VASSSKIEELVFQAVSKLETEGERAFATFLEAHPRERDGLIRMVRRLTGMGFLGDSPSQEFPKKMGEFELIERLGDGGMGVVFSAKQEGLKRLVALKVVRPEHLLFSGGRERFQREVQAVAKLQHPGILPVLSVGEEKGIPYFTMTLVQGASLAEILGELTEFKVEGLDGKTLFSTLLKLTQQKAQRFSWGQESSIPSGTEGKGLEEENWGRSIAHVFYRVCMAMDHAHTRRVLHRDLKPSNIMLTPDGRIYVVDFGLAREEESQELTRSGAVLGSPAYMPPELHNEGSKSLGVRSDIYSLGIALYEALALRLPFLGKTADEVRRSISAGTPVSLRVACPGLSKDLEAITMKALDVDPARRYSSMKGFAEDLGRFLRKEGVLARRTNPALRMIRWSRRHPARAFGGLAAFIGLVVLPLGLLYQESLAAGRLGVEKRQALGAFHLAKEAVDRFLVKVASKDFAKTPQTKAIRRTLLKEADRFYQGLQQFSLEENLGPSRLHILRRLMAWAHEMDPKKRDLYWGEARSLVSDLVAIRVPSKKRHSIQWDWAAIRSFQGEGLRLQGKAKEAREELLASLALYERVPPQSKWDLGGYFSCLLSMAYLDRYQGRFSEARKWFERILQEGKRVSQTSDMLRVRARVHLHLMGMEGGRKGVKKGIVHGRSALKLAEEACKRDASSPSSRLLLGTTQFFFGRYLFSAAGKKEGIKQIQKSIAQSRALLREYPDIPKTFFNMCQGAYILSKVAKTRGEDDLWRSHLEFARGELEGWCQAHPKDWDSKELFSKVMVGLGGYWLRKNKDVKQAEKAYLKSLLLAREVSEASPSNAVYRFELAKTLNDFAVLKVKKGELPSARKLLGEAVSLKRALLEKLPKHSPYQSSLARSLNLLAQIQIREGKRTKGLECFREAFALKKESLARHPKSMGEMMSFAVGAQNLAATLLRAGKVKEGKSVLNLGLATMKKLVSAYPKNARVLELFRRLEALK
jgi:serine/threonine protein kinase/tetratricopeptide (TPR) repeat protein